MFFLHLIWSVFSNFLDQFIHLLDHLFLHFLKFSLRINLGLLHLLFEVFLGILELDLILLELHLSINEVLFSSFELLLGQFLLLLGLLKLILCVLKISPELILGLISLNKVLFNCFNLVLVSFYCLKQIEKLFKRKSVFDYLDHFFSDVFLCFLLDLLSEISPEVACEVGTEQDGQNLIDKA